MTKAITVAPLARPIACGDWHDKPMKWQVNGPAQEVQHFSTKADATMYARCRRTSATPAEAARKFVVL